MRQRLFAFWDWLTGRAAARRLVAEFERDFPGKCAVCSFHRYGLSHCHLRPGTPVKPHACPEGATR